MFIYLEREKVYSFKQQNSWDFEHFEFHRLIQENYVSATSPLWIIPMLMYAIYEAKESGFCPEETYLFCNGLGISTSAVGS